MCLYFYSSKKFVTTGAGFLLDLSVFNGLTYVLKGFGILVLPRFRRMMKRSCAEHVAYTHSGVPKLSGSLTE